MLALTRTHAFMASSATSRDDCHHALSFASVAIRTGHKNVTPCRLIAVKIVAQVVSPCSAAYNVGLTR